MNLYKLAKELKDSGWPHPKRYPNLPGEWIGPNGIDHSLDQDAIYSPSLAELLAACPREIDGHRFMLGAWGKGWVATYWKGAFVGNADGETPEEAVAKLWLVLQKKDRCMDA